MRNTISPPCFTGPCEYGLMLGQSETGRDLCAAIAENLIAAGGAGILETTTCPYVAATECDPNGNDPVKAEIGRKLGIEAVYGGQNA